MPAGEVKRENFDASCAADSLNRARELDECPVPGRLDNPAAVLLDFWIH
jgi:hypothetical protein